jgi:hypothetical protein
MARKPLTTNAHDIEDRPQKYDPADFIIPARDNKGESVRVWNRIQPGHERALSTILQSKKFPFKTQGDVMRWCLHVGLKRLEKMEAIPSVTQQVDAMMTMLRDEEFQLEFQAFIQFSTHIINRHMSEGSHGEARRLVAQLKSRIEGMPDGYWRTKYLKAVDTSFGHLLNAKSAKVHLIPMRDEGDDDD